MREPTWAYKALILETQCRVFAFLPADNQVPSENRCFADYPHPVQHRWHPAVHLRSSRQRTRGPSNRGLRKPVPTVVACCCFARLKHVKCAKVQPLSSLSSERTISGGHKLEAEPTESSEQSAGSAPPAEPFQQPAALVSSEQLHGWSWPGQLVCGTISAVTIHHPHAWCFEKR